MKKPALIIAAAVLFSASCRTNQFPQEDYELAYDRLIAGEYTQATGQFAELSSKFSRYPEIWYQYGSCCMETGDYDTAIDAFNRAAVLYENSVMYDDRPGLRYDSLVTIGEVYLLQQDLPKAKNQFDRCLSLKNDHDMQVAIAATYIRLGFTEEMAAFFAEKGIDPAEL